MTISILWPKLMDILIFSSCMRKHHMGSKYLDKLLNNEMLLEQTLPVYIEAMGLRIYKIVRFQFCTYSLKCDINNIYINSILEKYDCSNNSA